MAQAQEYNQEMTNFRVSTSAWWQSMAEHKEHLNTSTVNQVWLYTAGIIPYNTEDLIVGLPSWATGFNGDTFNISCLVTEANGRWLLFCPNIDHTTSGGVWEKEAVRGREHYELSHMVAMIGVLGQVKDKCTAELYEGPENQRASDNWWVMYCTQISQGYYQKIEYRLVRDTWAEE